MNAILLSCSILDLKQELFQLCQRRNHIRFLLLSCILVVTYWLMPDCLPAIPWKTLQATGDVSSIHFSPDGTWLVTFVTSVAPESAKTENKHNTMQVWNVVTGECTTLPNENRLMLIGFSDNERALLVLEDTLSPQLIWYDLQDGWQKKLKPFRKESLKSKPELAISRDGEYFATSSGVAWPKSIKVYHPKSDQVVELESTAKKYFKIDPMFVPETQELVGIAEGEPNVLLMWSAVTGKLIEKRRLAQSVGRFSQAKWFDSQWLMLFNTDGIAKQFQRAFVNCRTGEFVDQTVHEETLPFTDSGTSVYPSFAYRISAGNFVPIIAISPKDQKLLGNLNSTTARRIYWARLDGNQNNVACVCNVNVNRLGWLPEWLRKRLQQWTPTMAFGGEDSQTVSFSVWNRQSDGWSQASSISVRSEKDNVSVGQCDINVQKSLIGIRRSDPSRIEIYRNPPDINPWLRIMATAGTTVGVTVSLLAVTKFIRITRSFRRKREPDLIGPNSEGDNLQIDSDHISIDKNPEHQ